jgi:hypothetical protein
MGRIPCRLLIVVLLTTLVVSRSSGLGAAQAPAVSLSALWEAPVDLQSRDLFHGPWGVANAPDPRATYTFMRAKEGGVSPGVVVRDPRGRVWHVKQPIEGKRGAEGPVEVTVSRVLSAVGFHQPPVYFLPSFTMTDSHGTHLEAGGRFRLDEPSLKARGNWRFQENPFVGMREYRGLIVILLMFNSFDLRSANNTLYEIDRGGRIDQWYVVRDLGGALGSSARMFVRRNNLERFERHEWIRNVKDGVVEFHYGGWNSELVRGISVDDLRWACELVGGLTERQWEDAFRAGGYPPDVARRFIYRLRARIDEGRKIAGGQWREARRDR